MSWTKKFPGAENPNAKLTEDQVREIRKLYKTHTTSWIAQKYGITAATVSSIGKRQSWRHLSDEVSG